MDWPKIRLILKNPQFLPKQAYIQVISWSFSPNFTIIGLKLTIFISSLIFGQSTFFATVSMIGHFSKTRHKPLAQNIIDFLDVKLTQPEAILGSLSSISSRVIPKFSMLS